MMDFITTYFTVLGALLSITALGIVVLAIYYKIEKYTQERFGDKWSLAVFIIYVIVAVSTFLTLVIILEGASV